MKLLKSQESALEYIREHAKTRKKDALKSIEHILKMSNISFDSFDYAISQLKLHGKVGLHFHPDRLDSKMKSVSENLLDQGIYKSQFETLISNGSVSAYPGGDRELWERKIYGNSYTSNTENSQRPKYGAFDLMLHPDGPAPRFGSCYFILKPNVSQRCTFTYLDSNQNQAEKGTIDEFDDILASLLTEVFSRDFALGEHNLTITKLINHFANNLSKTNEDRVNKNPVRNLNHYIEAQIHGDINLKNDVEKLIADPSFQGTYTGNIIEKMCKKYNISLYWHCGFALLINEVPSDFRGATMPYLARRISSKDYIDTSMIGIAAKSLKNNPNQWNDLGTYEEILQELKLLWHVLVKYGKPLKTFRNS